MASLLRQIVASPRARHPEADLDLCYVTDHIIATSGPSQTYPQRAYRNPLDRLVSFLNDKHGEEWAIWEFRAEGTGYPDDAVDGRVRHYPWPDHHPPPFRLMPMIMASMRNWLHGGELHSDTAAKPSGNGLTKEKKDKRVVVVHCKAGKGRSGTVSCSYLVSEEGWTAEDALARFTQRRMRPQFGAGVSIPSQLRWVSYVDRWTKGGKKYIDRPIEIVEVHVWGLRNGVKIDVEGFKDEGKKIQKFHTFTKEERMVVEGDAPEGSGLSDMMWELAGYSVNPKEKAPAEAELSEGANDEKQEKKGGSLKKKGTDLIKMASTTSARKVDKIKSKTFQPGTSKPVGKEAASTSSSSSSSSSSTEAEPGGMAVILKPKEPIRIPNSDVNISVERRNRTHKSMGLTMVTAVGHVWFNAFFEGNGPEHENKPSTSGVFSIEWEAMDGIKGTSRKGGRALDRLAVVWRVADGDAEVSKLGEEVVEPAEGTPVPQSTAADWKGANTEDTDERVLGLRTKSPESADVSQGSSVKSVDAVMQKIEPKDDKEKEDEGEGNGALLAGVKSSGPQGGELSDEEKRRHEEQRQGKDVLENPDRADGTVKAGTTEVVSTKK